MRFSEAWLRESVNPAITIDELVDQLTMAGLEVDGVEPVAGQFEGIVVGEVLDVKPHPNADKLKICLVSVGTDDPLSIVCGASNVYQGMRAPIALIGAILPGDFRIKKSKLRGEDSFGMLCSEQELGLAKESDGLMQLPDDAPLGSNVRDYFQLDDNIIDVDLTPNRADCLSVEGVAREVALLNQIDWKAPNGNKITVDHQQVLDVELLAPEACPKYLGRLIKNVNPKAKTPLWLQEKLRRSGIRSLSPLVDVTNYVLLELGQPLHAFDAEKIDGHVVVRFARDNEKLLLLNDQEIALKEDLLVISDSAKPLALAGIMGGRESAVSDETQDIFLECAFFAPSAMSGKARLYGLHTESSHRFERGVDPELQQRAIDRTTELILSIAGGEAGPTVEAIEQSAIPQWSAIHLRRHRIKRILGVEFSSQETETILRRLGMSVDRRTDGWLVTPPSFRFDIAIEADLIEELGRVYGYDKLPQSQLEMHVELGTDSETVIDANRLKDILVDRGYQEAITFSFVDSETLEKLVPDEKSIKLANPISSELSIMRTSLWPGLILAAQRNIHRQTDRVRLFESGLVFLNRQDEIQQKQRIAGLVTGSALPEQWGEKSRDIDFYDMKSDAESLLGLSRRSFTFRTEANPVLHPGQCAQIFSSEGMSAGWLGRLHPSLQKEFDFDKPVFLFELDNDVIYEKNICEFNVLSKYPQVRRDIAVIVNEAITADDLLESIYANNNNLIHNAFVFDVYRGKGVESSHKSVAMSLILQDYSDTLTDAQIDTIVSQVVSKLGEDFGAKLRE